MKTPLLNYDMLLLTLFTLLFASLTFAGSTVVSAISSQPISSQSAQTALPRTGSNERLEGVAAPVRVIGIPFILNTDPSVR